MIEVFSLLLMLASQRMDIHYTGKSCYACMSPNYPCDTFMESVSQSPNPATAVLWRTFGEDRTCLTRFIKEQPNKKKLLEIHFSNEACRRKRDCGQGEFLPGVSVNEYSKLLEKSDPAVLKAIDKRTAEILSFVASIADGNTTFVLSTANEDDLRKNTAYQHLARRIDKTWPFTLVRSPNGSNPFKSVTDYTEHHGTQTRNKGGISNQDGSNSTTCREKRSFLRGNKQSLARFLWDRLSQGSGLPRRSRKFTITKSSVRCEGRLLKEER